MMKRMFFAAMALATAAFAQRNDPMFLRDAVGAKSYPAAPRLAERASFAPATELPAAATSVPEEIERVRAWNEAGNTPAKNGFTRTLPDTIAFRATPGMAMKAAPTAFARGLVAASADGHVVYSTAIRVDGADRIRIRFDNVVIPDDAVFWVYGGGDEPAAFGKELLYDGTIWSPPVHGPVVYVDFEAPASAVSAFEIKRIAELLNVTPAPADSPNCLVDSTCISTSTFDSLAIAKKAVAHLEFVDGGDTYICTGALLNDRKGDGTPYLLTANHCISTQGVASTLTSFFDYISTGCNSVSNLSNAPRTTGATLLAASSTSDFSFLRLNSIPAGRALLGWDATTVTNGARLHRLSHPQPLSIIFPQMYSSTNISTTTSTCQAVPRPNFVYSTAVQGGIYGGSSGSPAMLDGGYVVGQLYGLCGPSPNDGCLASNKNVDGAFSVTYNTVKQWLENASAANCTPNAATVCLVNGRFSVSIDWKTSGGQSGSAQAIKYTDASALFWFFGPDNIEVLLKVLNACSLNSTYWVFAAATTDVEYTIHVTDTTNGKTKTYFHAGGTPAPAITDTNAFATCP
jgi:lysyl endopeptidase